MNQMLRNYIAVEGVEAALKVARTLIEQDYQVMVQLDDCDIYIVSYESNDDHLGDNQFASLSRDEIDIINKYREDENYEKAKKFLEEYEERLRVLNERLAVNEKEFKIFSSIPYFFSVSRWATRLK